MLAESSFEIQPTVRASFGRGVIGKLGKRLRALGAKRALLVTDAGIVRAGIASRVSDAATRDGVAVELFDGVGPNPTIEHVEQGAEVVRQSGVDVVVALGGGSSLDAAKAIALAGANQGPAGAFTFGCRPERPGKPVIAVPTTAGTGSETNMFGVVTDPALGRKILIAHSSVLPQLVLLDPELSVGAPQSVTGPCGMDVLTHAIEAFTSIRNNPYSDALALSAIEICGRHLPAAYADGTDLEARAQMLLASHLAGIAFSSSGLGMCHAMGHPLSARLGIAHGQTLATLLPHVMRFNLDACEERYARVATALGSPRHAAGDAISAVEALRERVGCNRSASTLGVGSELIPTLVEDAFADVLMLTTPKPPKPSDVAELYRAAL
jgi:alcohol dehydrogenase